MSRGYRSIVLAAFGWLILAASPPQEYRTSAHRADAPTNAEQSLSNIATALDQANQARKDDPGCKKGQDDRGSDLCAQWKAADAAYESAVWTRRMYPWIVVGTVIGVFTLIAAASAAWFAGDAAKSTRDNYRAFLAFESASLVFEVINFREITGTETIWSFKLRIRNMGRAPALVRSITIGDASSIYEKMLDAGKMEETETKLIAVKDDQTVLYCYADFASGVHASSHQYFSIYLESARSNRRKNLVVRPYKVVHLKTLDSPEADRPAEPIYREVRPQEPANDSKN